jgi:hypothetical protein
MKLILSHKELHVYQLAYKLAMGIFHISKGFPIEERYSLTDHRLEDLRDRLQQTLLKHSGKEGTKKHL